mgnify:CR=1 FL=1
MEGELLKENLSDNDHLFLGVLQDVTLSKLREIELNDTLDALENYKKAIDYSAIVSKSNQDGIITYVNDKFKEISGYSTDELVGAKHNIVNSHYHNKDFFSRMWKTINNGEVWKDIIRNQKKIYIFVLTRNGKIKTRTLGKLRMVNWLSTPPQKLRK